VRINLLKKRNDYETRISVTGTVNMRDQETSGSCWLLPTFDSIMQNVCMRCIEQYKDVLLRKEMRETPEK
jgi:hypothetical protein